MKPLKLKKGTFVFFDWIDSAGVTGWKTDPKYCSPSRIESFAMVVRSTDEALTVTTSFADYKTASEQFMDALSVPWVAITQFQKVNFKPKKRKHHGH